MTQPRHRWPKEGVHIAALDSRNGNDQTERACLKCGLIRITVHPPAGLPWVEWRRPGSRLQFPGETPPCCAAVEA